VIVVDFTKFTIVDKGSVSCFVVAVVSYDAEVMGVDGMFLLCEFYVLISRGMETSYRLL
jgi:hypothetical protein